MADTRHDGYGSDLAGSWRADRESYLPDDDPFAEQGLVGDPLGGSDYELVYRIVVGFEGRSYLSVAGYRGAPVNLDIPDSWDGMPVIEVEPRVFADCETLVTLTMADSVVLVGEAAFSNCKALRCADLSWSLGHIADDLFLGCDSLERIDIPEGVTRIGNSAFCCCAALRQVDLAQTVDTIDDHAFAGCASLISIDLALVDEIGAWAFDGCTSLDEVRVRCEFYTSDSVFIDAWAFKGCTSLKTVWIERPESVELGHGAFSGCTALEKVVISGGLEEVPGKAFFGCASLLAVKMSHKLQIIAEEAFAGCSSLRRFDLLYGYPHEADPDYTGPLDVECIEVGEGAFNSCPLKLTH